MDISETIAPNSDQLDAVDLLSGPRTFTIERVSKGNDEQPVAIHLAEFPRVWRPGKSMRRVLVACWGPDASKYAGRRVTLFCDLEVRFGGQAVGGTRVSHLSHLDKPKQVPLLIARGKSAVWVVKPLLNPQAQPETSEPDPRPVGETSPFATPEQITKIATCMTKLHITDRDSALLFVNDVLPEGRTVASRKDLSRAEASQVIDALEADLAVVDLLGDQS